MSESNNFCVNCGANLGLGNKFCPKCGCIADSDVSPQRTMRKRRVSKKSADYWYLLPIFLHIIGGIIAYFILRNPDRRKARNCLFIGTIIFIFYAIVFLSVGVSFNNFVEETESTMEINRENIRDDNSGTTVGENVEVDKQETITVGELIEKLSDKYGSESNKASNKKTELSPTQIKNKAIREINFDNLMRNNEKYVGSILYLEGKVIQVSKTYGDNYDLRVSITKETSGSFTFYTDPIWVNYAGERILEEDIVGIYGQVVGIKKYTAVLGNTIELPEVDSLLLELISKGD